MANTHETPVGAPAKPVSDQPRREYNVTLSADDLRLIRSALEGFKASYSHHEHVYRMIDQVLAHLPRS